MIHVTVTTVLHLLSDADAAKLGQFIQAIVATALDVPHDESAVVRNKDVSVEFREHARGTNMPAVSILVRAPDHPHRRKSLAERLRTISTALCESWLMPSATITAGRGGVSVEIELTDGVAMRL